MKPNGRRAWRRAAKKLRRTMGRRWRSQKEWLFGKRWSEFVPDLEAHRAHVTGAWFKRHGFTELNLDAPHPVRVYIGLWGTADGDGVEYVVKPQSFSARSLVGMTMGARKRAARKDCHGIRTTVHDFRALLRIGERLRRCPGCFHCQPGVKGWHIDRSRSGRFNMPALALHCDGSGVLPARRSK